MGGEALGVGDDPALQAERGLGEGELDMAEIGLVGLNQGQDDLAALVFIAGDGDVAAQPDVLFQEKGERGLAGQEMARLFQLSVEIDGLPAIGDDQDRVRLVVVEAHLVRPGVVEIAGGGVAARLELDEARAERAEIAEIGLDLLDLRRGDRAWLRRGGVALLGGEQSCQQKTAGHQVTKESFHAVPTMVRRHRSDRLRRRRRPSGPCGGRHDPGNSHGHPAPCVQ